DREIRHLCRAVVENMVHVSDRPAHGGCDGRSNGQVRVMMDHGAHHHARRRDEHDHRQCSTAECSRWQTICTHRIRSECVSDRCSRSICSQPASETSNGDGCRETRTTPGVRNAVLNPLSMASTYRRASTVQGESKNLSPRPTDRRSAPKWRTARRGSY